MAIFPIANPRKGPFFQILRRCDGTATYGGSPCDSDLLAPDPKTPSAVCAKCSAFRIAANKAAFARDMAAQGA